jgi:molybdate transport system substrate-binding protein
MNRARAGLRTSLVWNLSVVLSTMGLVGSTQLSAQELLVAAASDLGPTVAELTREALRNQKLTLRVSIGSSGQLARQIEQGAPFDLFLSANENFVRQVVQSGRGDASTVRIYAVGRLALWSKSGSIGKLEDLAGPDVKRIAMANPNHAPYGQLAKEALKRAGLWAKVEPKLILAETVRQTMQFAGTGNVDAALTSWTMAHDKGGVLLPDSLRQAGVVIKKSKNAAAAQAFLSFLSSSGGQRILGRHGLLPGNAAGEALLQELENHDGNGKSGRADEQAQKSKRLRPAQKRNKNQ